MITAMKAIDANITSSNAPTYIVRAGQLWLITQVNQMYERHIAVNIQPIGDATITRIAKIAYDEPVYHAGFVLQHAEPETALDKTI